MTRVALVTGATGFLGRHLVAALGDAGYQVVAWVRNPADAAFSSDVRVVRWPDARMLREGIAELDHPTVFHLACAGVTDRTQRTPAIQFEVNVLLTAWLVQASAEAAASGFVYAGTCAEYGNVLSGERIRESAPLAATDLYGASKAAAGLWVQAVARNAGLGFAWARLFGLYGPGERYPRLLPAIYAALRDGSPIDLTLGIQQRDWLFVSDAATGMVRLGRYAEQGGQGIYNLCSGIARSTRDVAAAFAHRMGGEIDLLRFGALPMRAEEPAWLVGDPTAIQTIGWSAATDIDPGLDLTLEAFRIADRHKHGAMTHHGP